MKLKKKITIISSIDCSCYLELIDPSKYDLTVVLPYLREEKLLPIVAAENISNFGFPVKFVSYKNGELKKALIDNSTDVIISIGWRRILSQEIFGDVKLAVNIHPAILPLYKGYHTEPYVIMNNEKEHGITAHILTEQLDAGDILLQKKFGISEFSTVKTLKDKVNKIAPSFFLELLESIMSNNLNLKKQDYSKTKIVAGKRTPEDSIVDPSKSLDELYHEIRACDPELYPAYFMKNGKKIAIKIFSIDGEKENVFDI